MHIPIPRWDCVTLGTCNFNSNLSSCNETLKYKEWEAEPPSPTPPPFPGAHGAIQVTPGDCNSPFLVQGLEVVKWVPLTSFELLKFLCKGGKKPAGESE